MKAALGRPGAGEFISQSWGKVFGVQDSRGGRYGSHPGGSPAWQPSRRGNQSLRNDYAGGDARRRSKTHAVCVSDPRIRCTVHAVEMFQGGRREKHEDQDVLFSLTSTAGTRARKAHLPAERHTPRPFLHQRRKLPASGAARPISVLCPRKNWR